MALQFSDEMLAHFDFLKIILEYKNDLAFYRGPVQPPRADGSSLNINERHSVMRLMINPKFYIPC